MNTMKKSDLRTGMLVTLRNKNSYYVMLNTGISGNQADVLIHKVGNDIGWMPLCQYDSDLLYHDDPYEIFPSASELVYPCPEDDRLWDIMQVDACREAVYLFQPSNHYRTIWKREEEE